MTLVSLASEFSSWQNYWRDEYVDVKQRIEEGIDYLDVVPGLVGRIRVDLLQGCDRAPVSDHVLEVENQEDVGKENPDILVSSVLYLVIGDRKSVV